MRAVYNDSFSKRALQNDILSFLYVSLYIRFSSSTVHAVHAFSVCRPVDTKKKILIKKYSLLNLTHNCQKIVQLTDLGIRSSSQVFENIVQTHQVNP